jgi:hypothetical protein
MNNNMQEKPINKAFATLGKFFYQVANDAPNNDLKELNDLFLEKFKTAIHASQVKNKWFTKDNINIALTSWANTLIEDKINAWIKLYPINSGEPKKVGVIMAGNIPLVGFHDFMSVLLSGNKIYAKPSSNDDLLLFVIAEILCFLAPQLKEYIYLSEQFIKDKDAYIATGSNNSTRYFEYYFKDKPFIIRGNRNSAAVILGNETHADFELLGKDIFQYYGLGCRNVSKLFVPKGYRFDSFFEGIYSFSHMLDNFKYTNNYEYNRTVYLLNSIPLYDNNFLILKEDKQLSSPVAVLFYEYYEDEEDLKNILENNKNQLQCVVSAQGKFANTLPFGSSQNPGLNDYADNVDTMKFLTTI